MRTEFTHTGDRQIVVRGEFIFCALVLFVAFLLVRWVAVSCKREKSGSDG